MKRLVSVLACAATAGCVLYEQRVSYPLRNGSYVASWDTIEANDCFPDGLPIPRGYTLYMESHVDSSDRVVLEWPPISGGLAPIRGELRHDGSFDLTGFVPYVLTSGCTLDVATSLSGVGIRPTLVPFELTIAFDAGTTAVNGLPSDCSELAGGTVDNLAFPMLSDPANGSCSLTVKGMARHLSPW